MPPSAPNKIIEACRLAILGCGATTEQFYLPALRDLDDTRLSLLVANDTDRRTHLASRFDFEHIHNDVDECYEFFDAAIVALPPALRRPICIKLLAQRKAVLVEQPMGISVAECNEMIHASKQTGTLLVVSQSHRFVWADRLIHFFIESEAMGRIESFDFRYSSVFDRIAASDITFRKEVSGGGVLMQTGFHVLDCILRWLGDFSDVEYFDDAAGGVEANALTNLCLQNGLSGVVELSCTRQLRNTAIIRCERGTIEIGLDTNSVKLAFSDQYAIDGRISDLKEPGKSQDRFALTRAQIQNFVAAIRNNCKAEVDAQSSKSTIRLIETCYHRRKPLQFIWAYQ